MGLGDMLGKGKDALGDEEKTDQLLDKGQQAAGDRFSGQEDKIQQGRDAIDDRIGDGGQQQDGQQQ
ncbi:antitoxin [Epidermidibacterium keratini]|uniref:Antitoxin n=1 Tax=Epidermidibacterium keratini TaxID=1891644 RepID=A0A7L4YP27_9ACTN|nr:Rv0909 family putative TA system antitoxin [Epidermidibacterium keratini]QHC00653.1 antitoxin [Epidermidibacterium keratini]